MAGYVERTTKTGDTKRKERKEEKESTKRERCPRPEAAAPDGGKILLFPPQHTLLPFYFLPQNAHGTQQARNWKQLAGWKGRQRRQENKQRVGRGGTKRKGRKEGKDKEAKRRYKEAKRRYKQAKRRYKEA